MKQPRSFFNYLGAIGLVCAASLVCETVRTILAPTNMVMAYLLAVVLASVWLGLWPAIITAGLSVLAFDVLFIPPRFSLRVSDTEYLITFFALFVVGVVISTLVARVHEKIEQITNQEARTSSLYALTRDLSAAADMQAIAEALRRAVLLDMGSRLTFLVCNNSILETVHDDSSIDDERFRDITAWVLKSGRRAGQGTAAFPDSSLLFVPIKSSVAVLGVMVLDGSKALIADNFQIIEAYAAQAAMAIERVTLASHAEEARFLKEKNHLEQALLNSISHDLRTPLVTISGVFDSMLTEEQAFTPEQRRSMIQSAAEETDRLNRFVGNLLDMTRLESGALALRVAPCEVEEIIGCALNGIGSRIGSRRVVTSVSPGLPLVNVDVALMTQVIVNLLDNAIKHTPSSGEITVSAYHDVTSVILAVIDNGPGIPPGQETLIFDKFHRIEVPESTGGTGLGLSIVKGIVEAHQGTVTAANSPEGGLVIEVKLPTFITGDWEK